MVESSSGIFKHAFEDGQLSEDDQKPRIYLAEASDVVETLLTYCYPFLMPGFELTSNSWDVICAAHKYQVSDLQSHSLGEAVSMLSSVGRAGRSSAGCYQGGFQVSARLLNLCATL